jgi:hypothetical protein
MTFENATPKVLFKYLALQKGGTAIFGDGVESFTMSYDVQWDAVSVYGRLDPIQTYKSTGQTFQLVFWVKGNSSMADGELWFEKNSVVDTVKRELQQKISFNDLKLFASRYARALYDTDGNIIEAPVVEIQFPYEKNIPDFQWINAKCILTSISLDYGDTARFSAARGEGRDFGDFGDVKAGALIPQKVIVSISGAIVEETVNSGQPDVRRHMKVTGKKSGTATPLLPAQGVVTPAATSTITGADPK